MEVRRQPEARAYPVHSLREGHVSQGPSFKHPDLEQGPGGDPEAGTRRGLAVPDADFEPAPQVRVRPPQRRLTSTASSCNSGPGLPVRAIVRDTQPGSSESVSYAPKCAVDR